MQRFAQIHFHVPDGSCRRTHHVCAPADLCYALDLDVAGLFLDLGEVIFHLHAEPHFRAHPTLWKAAPPSRPKCRPCRLPNCLVLGASHRDVLPFRSPSIPTVRYTLGGQCVQDEEGFSCAYLESLGVVPPIYLRRVRASSLVVACRGPQREPPRHYRATHK